MQYSHTCVYYFIYVCYTLYTYRYSIYINIYSTVTFTYRALTINIVHYSVNSFIFHDTLHTYGVRYTCTVVVEIITYMVVYAFILYKYIYIYIYIREYACFTRG